VNDGVDDRLDGGADGEADELSRLLDELLGASPAAGVWSWPDSRLVEAHDLLHEADQRVIAAQLVLLREIDGRGLARRMGGATSAAWLRNRHHLSIGTAARRVRLAAALDADLPATAAALAAGDINAEQAQVIADAVMKLPGGLRAEGEQRLLETTDQADPKVLAAAGASLLETLDPDEAERREQDREARLAARAHLARDFRLVDQPGTSLVRLYGKLDRESAAILRAGLDTLCSPRQQTSARQHTPPRQHTAPRQDTAQHHSPDEPALATRSVGQRRADALVEIFRIALAGGELPDNGGERPQVVVTAPLETLQQAHGTATLEDGGVLTAAAARRWACDAKVIPMILGGAGQPLDVGRTQRLFTGPLRRALVVRDGGCAFPGCDRPPRWCDGHHIRSWLDGGPTSLSNAVLLCHPHHRLVHEGDWSVRLNPDDAIPEFIPPPFLDPSFEQRPRRNLYHRRERAPRSRRRSRPDQS
jgi:hypothetical protein